MRYEEKTNKLKERQEREKGDGRLQNGQGTKFLGKGFCLMPTMLA